MFLRAAENGSAQAGEQQKTGGVSETPPVCASRKTPQILEKSTAFLAPAGGFEPLAYRLGVASIRYSSVPVKRVKPLILLDFTVVTLLVMYGFFLLIFIVFCGRN